MSRKYKYKHINHGIYNNSVLPKLGLKFRDTLPRSLKTSLGVSEKIDYSFVAYT